MLSIQSNFKEVFFLHVYNTPFKRKKQYDERTVENLSLFLKSIEWMYLTEFDFILMGKIN